MRHDESALQVAVMAYLRAVLPSSVRAFAIPNGLHTSKLQAARAVKEGLTAGVLDICLVRSNGLCAFIELKVGKNKLSEAQFEFLDWCVSHFIPAAVCRSIDDVRDCLAAWHIETREAA
jgi:VRR-NUC domain